MSYVRYLYFKYILLNIFFRILALTRRGEDYCDPLINSKTVKAVSGKTWHIAALSNFSLETFMANLISMTNPSLQMLDKTQTGVFSISGFLVKPPVKKNCHNQ